jgi:hypothetical protein
MKKRTLNQTWTLCLRMWRNIAKKWGKRKSVSRQKRLWLMHNGFEKYEINADCFFCDYDKRYNRGCRSCPGRLVDFNFNCNNEPSFCENPPAFYKELLRLNRIRKKK